MAADPLVDTLHAKVPVEKLHCVHFRTSIILSVSLFADFTSCCAFEKSGGGVFHHPRLMFAFLAIVLVCAFKESTD